MSNEKVKKVKTSLGDRLRQVRTDLGFSLKELAERVQCSPSYLSKLETGKVQHASERFLAALADCVEVNFEWLKTGEGNFSDNQNPEQLLAKHLAGAGLDKHRMDEVLRLLPYLPDALAADTVLERLLPALNLLRVQETWAQIRSIDPLPVPARLFWNEVFFRLQRPAMLRDFQARLDAQKSGPVASPAESVVTESAKIDIDTITENRYNTPVQTELSNLITRLNKAAQATGKKAELADFLGVPRQRISEWLSGKTEPGGETTLRLLHWVEDQESRQQLDPTRKTK